MRLGFFPKLWFGFGQAAEGMKNTAFNAFLLLFYSQVLGLPAYLGGLALGIALVVDAITDPMTGSISDSLSHRWGRRHPFMYAAAIPMWITFAFAFRPPDGLGEAGLLLWMLAFTILARLAMTLYHVPHLALGAELTSDYDERTSVVAYRNFFGLAGGAVLILVCRQVFLAPTEAFPNGELNPSAYPPMALLFGGAMAFAILASALGTHRRSGHSDLAGPARVRIPMGRRSRVRRGAGPSHGSKQRTAGPPCSKAVGTSRPVPVRPQRACRVRVSATGRAAFLRPTFRRDHRARQRRERVRWRSR